MEPFDFKTSQEVWSAAWEQEGIYHAKDFSDAKKFYCLVEFPYPSGEGLHVGHPRSYTALDIIARKRRMEGCNVLFPIGWDAFGLPAENYAIKTGTHPRVTTEKNIANFRRQLKALGFSFDWSREVNTTDPAYYKWTQWIFLQLFRQGLAYKKKMFINWCPKDKVGLANEEVVNGCCERCGTPVIQKEREQWMLKITAYAQRLLDDLATVDYPERVKKQQEEWIGRSEGARIRFPIVLQTNADKNADQRGNDVSVSQRADQRESAALVEVFTTRPDTLFGATFLVVSPEHPILETMVPADHRDAVRAYQEAAKMKNDLERTELQKEKTGVFSGAYAINPATEKQIPIWIADYVLMTYGTGAIMAVPAHDERDFAFAKKYDVSIIPVISGGVDGVCYQGEGALMNSGAFDGMESDAAARAITKKFGTPEVQFKLRDWVFSRQRYWGEPIPLVFCEACKKQVEIFNDQFPISNKNQESDSKFNPPVGGQNSKLSEPYSDGERLNPGWVPIPDDQLPVVLPEVEKYQTTDTGDSPLALMPQWVETTCPRCGGPARHETDTMPQWAGSSWYYLRYTDPHNDTVFADKGKLAYWTPVDWYNGGMEHTTLHLLYSRFWHKFLFDIGVVPTSEPYAKRTSHGLILGEGGEKMSKSRGNVVNPDVMVNEFGADAFRTYEMFMGPFEESTPWSNNGILGVERFLNRAWKYILACTKETNAAPLDADTERVVHKTIRKVSQDIEAMSFNTAVSALMILLNTLEAHGPVPRETSEICIQLLSPFAPFMTEELWRHHMGHTTSVSIAPWPAYDAEKIKDDVVTIAVQIGGKMRGTVRVAADASQADVEKEVMNDAGLAQRLAGGQVRAIKYVPGRIINFIIA